MSSVEDLAAVRIAIELCNSNELKEEVLCVPGSECDGNRSWDSSAHQAKWKEILENKATTILKTLGLPGVLLEKVTRLVILIGMRILTWAKYYEGIIGLSREYRKFLNSSFFTSHGIIDNKKAAEELMKIKSLSIAQKYKLACLYCLTEHIPDLYRKMNTDDKEDVYNHQPHIKRLDLATFWSDCLSGRIDDLRGEKTLDEYMLEKAINCGSKTAVEYCLEKTSIGRKKDAVVDAALKTVRNGMGLESTDYSIIFEGYQDRDNSWIPTGYFVDILYFLMSKMREDQKIEFLKKDIEEAYEPDPFINKPKYSRVLQYLLNISYQNYFMETAQLMWEFLPEERYADLLLKICNKINFSIMFGEGEYYDYRKLLREFWCQSPAHYKRFTVRDIIITPVHEPTLPQRENLLFNLFRVKHFTYEDWNNIKLILIYATDEEKQDIIYSKLGKTICEMLMEAEKWEILDGFVSNCLTSKEKEEEFKRGFVLTEAAQRSCVDFIEKKKVDAAESFIKWSCLPEEEISGLKREIIPSCHARKVCMDLFFSKNLKIAKKFCEWRFSSEEEIRKFKKELIFSSGVAVCADLIIKDKFDVVDDFIDWSLFSPEKIKEFKKHLQCEKGNDICEKLISGIVRDPIWGCNMFHRKIIFKGGKWDQIEKYLTWSFSSEKDMRDFKKERLAKESGKKIHFHLIQSNRWEDAKIFFAWLGLSPEEVKELKKETLFNYEEASEMFRELVYSSKSSKIFSEFGSRQEAIELFLRWYLIDKETVLEFRDQFKQKYEGKEIREVDRAVLEDFDSAIEQRLSDLDEEQREANRKSELSKDLCIVELYKN